MIGHSKTYAIIPARGGSKRIKDKNIKDFLGKPLIAYSIQTALKCGFDEVIVSTDSCQIAQIAIQHNAKVPFLREASLSDDFTPTLEVIADAIVKCQIQEDCPVCCLYPTAPLIQPKEILSALEMLDSQTSYVFCASAFDFNPLRGFYLEDTQLKLLFPQHQNQRSQDLPTIYHDAGAFYLGYAKHFKNKIPIFSPNSKPLLLPSSQVQDIDTLEDFELAKLKYIALYAN